MRSLRRIGVIAMNQLQRLLLEGALIWLIALPIAIIFVLGISLQGVFSAQFVPAEPYRVIVAGAGTDAVIETFRGAREFLTVETAGSAAEARQQVLAEESDAAVLVPEGFPHEPVTIVAPPAGLVAQILAPVVRTAAARAGGADAATVDVAVTEVAVQPGAGESGRADAPWMSANAFQYYGIGLTVMFAMFAGHVAMTYCAGDRASGAYARIRASGVSRPTYMVAGFASAVLMAALFIGFMRAATSLIYGVAWGQPLAWAVLTLAGAAGVAAISFVVMSLAPRNPKVVDDAGSVLFVLLAFLGGSNVPLPAMPDWFARAFAWLPNRAVLDGFFELSAGGGFSAITDELRILGVATLLLFVVAWVISSVRARGEA